MDQQQPGAVGPDSAFDGLLLESDPEAAEPWFEPEPAAEPEVAVGAEPEPVPRLRIEPVDALATGDDMIEAEPEASVETSSVPDADEPDGEPSVEAESEGSADAEPSWDRDRYTARIEEPDWIPEERSPQPAATTSPEAEALATAAPSRQRGTESAEPPWVGGARQIDADRRGDDALVRSRAQPCGGGLADRG